MFFPGFVTLDCHEKKISACASNLAFQKIRENEKFMIIKNIFRLHTCMPCPKNYPWIQDPTGDGFSF